MTFLSILIAVIYIVVIMTVTTLIISLTIEIFAEISCEKITICCLLIELILGITFIIYVAVSYLI